MDRTSLQDKVVVVTGASRGIGRETVKLLANSGAKIVIGSRNEDQLNKLKDEVEHAEILPIPLDVKDEASVIDFVKIAVNSYGRVDALINSAGVGTFSSILDLSTYDFDEMIAVNLRGTFLCCKYFGKLMVEQQNGHIINISSIAGQVGLPGSGGYSASKFGVNGITKVMQTELRQKGIQVTSVMPGSVSSPFWNEIENKPDLSLMIPPPSIAQYLMFLLSQPKGTYVDDITIMPPLGIL